MFHYQCTIFIAATKNHKIQTLSKSSSFMIHCIQFACAHSVSHTPQRQARTVLKTSTDNHPSSCHLHQLLRSSKTRDYQHLGILFHDVRAQMTKGVDHFGECFVQVRPINQLFSCKYRTFGQMSGLSTYFPFSLAFYFTIILTTRLLLCFQHGGVATIMMSALGTIWEYKKEGRGRVGVADLNKIENIKVGHSHTSKVTLISEVYIIAESAWCASLFQSQSVVVKG